MLLQLERFDRAREQAQPVPRFGPADLDAAHARGLAEGAEAARQDATERLIAELAGMQAALARHDADRAGERRAAVQSLAPVLDALVAGALPAVARARLQSALLQELTRLADTARPLQGVVRCGPDLAPFVAACAERAGLTGLAVDDSGPPGTAEARVTGGVIAFDQQSAAQELRQLLSEFIEGA
ncbi:hypothetical protein [Paracoccus luteus]|uniref:hypothetical protein n=1 Tax=Paracoccus luteus TaxID=2508543 RepID=UPI00106FBD64|nr:hypothetical protein [Paracoccus luteus]